MRRADKRWNARSNELSDAGSWGAMDYPDMVALPPDKTIQTRYVAIGASLLNGSTATVTKPGRRKEDFFSEYRDRIRKAVSGHSIYLYHEK